MTTRQKMDDFELAECWIAFKAGDASRRNDLVEHYTSFVKYMAARVGSTLPPFVDRDDLVSSGMFGLLDALDKFDPHKGVKFETYAGTRVWGSIYDELRLLDWVPRSIHAKAKDIAKAREEVEVQLGRPAEHSEVAMQLGLSPQEYSQLLSKAHVTPVTSTTFYNDTGGDDSETVDVTFDPMANPEELFEAGEIADLVAEAVDEMDAGAKTILVLYYLQEMTLAEIGELLGVTESWVCQLQSKALKGLRDSLGRGGLVAA